MTTPPSRSEVLEQLRARMIAFATSRYAREAAEDLAQEVLVLIHEKYGHLEALEDLVPLGVQILAFKLQALRRKARRRGEDTAVEPETFGLASPDPDPEALAERAERAALLRDGLSRLGPRCRELFRLKLQGFAFPDIQVRMGAGSVNTVYTWDLRCRKQLQAFLGGGWAP